MGNMLPFGIQRSTLAGGLSGIISWGLMLGLAAAGIVIPAAAITPIALLIATAVVHFVPDAAKVDAEIKDAANFILVLEDKFPGDDKKDPVIVKNFNQ